jgi:hypothetical protein
MAVAETNWPTVCASEVRQGFQDRSRGMKGSQESLTTAVVKDAANWPTATATNRVRSEETMAKCAAFRKRNANQNTVPLYLEEVVLREQLHGQAAPASSSSLGSRQGLSWATPRATEAKLGRRYTPGMTGKDLTKDVMQWGTPAANDANKQNVMCEVNSKQAGLPKSVGLELQRPWMTPNARDWKGAHGEHFGDRARTQSLNNQMEAIGNKGAKLNPRWVEALMGLPIGWTMPSCTSPQTIAPMSCDSSAMELCQPPQSGLLEC